MTEDPERTGLLLKHDGWYVLILDDGSYSEIYESEDKYVAEFRQDRITDVVDNLFSINNIYDEYYNKYEGKTYSADYKKEYKLTAKMVLDCLIWHCYPEDTCIHCLDARKLSEKVETYLVVEFLLNNKEVA